MRTTVTLDPDTEQMVRRHMREKGMSFKEALNDLIRAVATAAEPFRTETASMGIPAADLDRALARAGELEDEELIRRMRRGS